MWDTSAMAEAGIILNNTLIHWSNMSEYCTYLRHLSDSELRDKRGLVVEAASSSSRRSVRSIQGRHHLIGGSRPWRREHGRRPSSSRQVVLCTVHEGCCSKATHPIVLFVFLVQTARLKLYIDKLQQQQRLCNAVYNVSNAAFTPDTCSPDTSCIHLYPLSPSYMYPVSATKLLYGDMYPLVSG